MAKHIMLAFVSPVSDYRLKNPINYPKIQGAAYSAIQTNESAVVYVERLHPLSKVFLIVSDKAKNELIESEKVTHVEFLKRRLIKEFPALENKFLEQDYSDASENLEKNILQIAEIANAVTEYAKNFPDEKIFVHADMTGGFRHTSMLMLSIIQLLKYRGIEIGEILYSDPDKKIVYRVNEIQKVSTLITGADEFVKFGSVEALQEYFKNNPNKTTTALLNAMKRFSEAIKICHTSAIKDELKNLGKQIKIFRTSENKDVQSEIFAKIIDTVESEYGNLLEGNTDSIDIIRWCMKKGFWQQAMTLCTEWLPLEIINRKIFEPTNQKVIKDAEIDGLISGRDWQQHFIISYNHKNNFQIDNELVDFFCKDLRALLKNLPNPFAEKLISDTYGDLKNLLEEHLKAYDAFKLCIKNKLSLGEFKQKYSRLYGVFEILNKEQASHKKLIEYLKKFDYNNFFVQIAGLKSETLLDILKINKNAAINFVMEKSENLIESKWENRAEIYSKMLSSGVAKSKLNDKKKILEILNGYYKIRRERNHLNHANSTERKEIPDLEKMIVNYLDELEKI